MDQITRTVNTFLSYIIGIGLICFFSFVFLLASARLNNSALGGLLAQSAGETARMARSESFSFWGQVGQQVATGLGVSSVIGGAPATYPIITPQAAQATVAPATGGGGAATSPAPTPVPVATSLPVPTNYIRSSGVSEGGLLRWQGLEADGSASPGGASIESVRDQADLALKQNSGDLLALWLMGKWRTCEPYLTAMRGDFTDPAQNAVVRQGTLDVINKCNGRVYEAYVRQHWADLVSWALQPQPKDSDGATALKGMTFSIGSKIDGPQRIPRPEDHVPISFPPDKRYNLPGATFTVTVGVLNQAFGGTVDDNKWSFNKGPYTVPGSIFPAEPPKVDMPTEADLTPPVVAPTAKAAQGNTQGTNPGTYTVQAGDTVYGIARKFNVGVDALISANPNTLGFNPNYITPGMELNIPAATP